MKKLETLEEAAENYGWRIKKNTFSDRVKANELADSAKQDFIEGANWQAERMFSKEEVNEIISAVWISCEDNEGKTFTEVRRRILEQFKKK
jgi:hypothetical protein